MSDMTWKKVLLLASGSVVVITIVFVAWLFTANLGVFKSSIESWVTEFTGREFSIDGELDIFLGNEIVVLAEGIRLQNADWADEPDMVSVGRIEVLLDTWSLFGGPVRIEELVVDDPSANLAKNENGRANWQFLETQTTDDEPPGSAETERSDAGFIVRRIDITNASLNYVSPSREGPVELSVAQLSQGLDEEGFLDLEADATLGGREFTVNATAGTWDDLLARRDIDFEFSSVIDTLVISGDGYIDDLLAPSRPRLELSVRGPDLNDLARLLQSSEQFEADVDLALNLEASDDGSMALDFRGNLGRLEATAQGAFRDLQHLENANLQLALAGPDLGRLLSLFGGPRLPAAPYSIDIAAERRGPEMIVNQAHMEYADAIFDLSADLPSFPALDDGDIRLAIDGQRFERFRELTGMPGAATGPYSMSFELADPGTGPETLTLALQSSLGTLTGDGTLGDAPDYLGSVFDFQINAGSLASLAEAYGWPALPARPVSLSGGLEVVDGGIRTRGPVSANSEDISISVDGLVSLGPGLVGSRLTLDGDLPDLSAAERAFLNSELLPAQPLSLNGALQINEVGYQLPDLRVTLGSGVLEFDALISRQPNLVGSDISLLMEGPEIESLTEQLKTVNFRAGPFTLSANVQRTTTGVHVEDLEFTRPRGRIGGDIEIDLPFDDRGISFDLSGRGPDLAHFGGLFGDFEPAEKEFSLVARGNNRGRLLSLDRFDVQFGQADFSARGTLDFENIAGNTRLSLGANVPDLAELGKYKGRAFNPQGFALNADVGVDGQSRILTVENLSARIGESDIRGLVMIKGGEPPELTVRIASDSLSYSRLLVQEEVEYDPEPEFDDGRLIPDLPIPFDLLERLNAEVEVDIGELKRDRLDMRSLELRLNLEDGQLKLDRFGFLGPSGWMQAQGEVERVDGLGRAEFQLGARDLTMGFSNLNRDLSARARFDVNLEATGNDLRTLVGGMNGAIYGRVDNLTVIESVILKRLYGDLLQEIVSVINPFAEQSNQQKLNCVVVPLSIKNGLVKTAPDMLIRTDRLRIVSEASVNLANERIDLQFTTTPRNGITISAGELFNPYVKVVGTLARPRLAVDQEGVLISGGAAVATGGLSMLAQAAWRRLNRSSDPCGALEAGGLEALGEDAFFEFSNAVPDSE